MTKILDILVIFLSIILITLIILQQRGGSYGSLFGFSGTLPFFQRRGLEKYLFILTWVIAIMFLVVCLLRVYL